MLASILFPEYSGESKDFDPTKTEMSVKNLVENYRKEETSNFESKHL